MTETVKYRSKYAGYQVGPEGKTLKFTQHMAQTSDPAVIREIEKAPAFGPGMDFWRDDPSLASVPAPPKPAPAPADIVTTETVKSGGDETTETKTAETAPSEGGKKGGRK